MEHPRDSRPDQPRDGTKVVSGFSEKGLGADMDFKVYLLINYIQLISKLYWLVFQSVCLITLIKSFCHPHKVPSEKISKTEMRDQFY